MSPKNDDTWSGKAVKAATRRENAPYWIVYLVLYNFGQQQILWYTDEATRAAFFDAIGQIPSAVLWMAQHTAEVAAALGVIALIVKFIRGTLHGGKGCE